MGDELRGENLVHLNVRFSTETELKKIQDFLYEKSGQGVSFTGLVEAMANEVTIVTAVHNIKANKGSRTAGVDKMKMDKYLQMPKDELILLIQSSFRNYRPKPARREYIEKSNGKKRPLGIPTVLDRIIQECVRIIIEPIQRKRVELIAKDFNEYTANEPKVSFRNGRYYVMDGQHTIEARILRNGGKDLPILCKVYTGLTMQQEALFFAEQNGHAAPLTAGIKLRAKVVGEDAPSVAFLAATNRVGLDFNYDSLQLSDYRISCVGTALKLYNQMGEKIYCEALRLIVAAWEGKPDSFRASVLRGMMHFVELYHGEFSEERLIRALRSVHPMEIYRSGMDNPAKLPGWKKYVFPIYTAYNGKCRKDALPMKF